MTDSVTDHLRIVLKAALGLVLTLGFAHGTSAQTLIEAGPPGTINNAIAGDTTATGERAECHYILQRDAVYIYDSKIRIEGDCDWIIEAEDGDGARPIIKPAALPGGEEAPRQFQVYTPTTITFRDLYLDGYDTSLPDPGTASDNAMIRVSVDSARIFIDNVRFDRNRQSAMRTDNESTKWYITNSQFSNLHNATRPDQGFVFDTRGNQIDTLSFVNNSVWNLTGQFMRGSGDARITYLKMDHNTLVNVGGAPQGGGGRLDTLRAELPGEQNWSPINLGQSKYAVFRNNLLVNPAFFGTEDNEVFVPRYVVNIDSMVTELDSVTFQVVPPEGVDIRNNVIDYDDALLAAYPDTIRRYTEAEFYDPTLDLFIEAQGTGDTMLETEVPLDDAPDVPLAFVSTYWEIVTGNQEAEPLILPRDTRNLDVPEGTLDLSYPATNPAYTAGTDGMPVGDLNWFGMAAGYQGESDQFATIGTSTDDLTVPDGFALRGNYPNPFNPTTSIAFDLPTAANVTVEVFDVLGRRVMTVPAQPMQAGTELSVRVDAGSLASGMYLYRVTAETVASTMVKSGTMMLLK